MKVPAGKWLATNVVAWGIATTIIAAARDYRPLVASRLFVAVFKAAIVPSLLLLVSQYYNRSEQAPRFALWYTGLGVGQILCGVMSSGFQLIQHAEVASWRTMFLAIGLVTVVLEFATYFMIPDTPMKARFLFPAEKPALLEHVSHNQTGVVNHHFEPRQISELLLDPQIYLLMITTILVRRQVIVIKVPSGADIPCRSASLAVQSAHTLALC